MKKVSTKNKFKKQRVTTQVRIDINIYTRVKKMAKSDKKTISKTLDNLVNTAIKMLL